MDVISIIIPVYNGEKYLEKTVNSILESSYQNIEIMLVNDGSTDNSLEICWKLENKDQRIRVINQKNAGVAAARNVGLQNATGNWIAFCDQDDLISPDMYQIMLDRIKNDASDMAICGMSKLVDGVIEEFEKYPDMVLERKNIVEQAIFSILFDGYDYSDYYVADPRINIGNCIWKCLIRHDLIKNYNIQFKRFINYEDDRTFLLELLAVAQKVSLVKECLYAWRINLKSETYRRRYIDDIYTKMENYKIYEIELLKKAGIEEDVIREYGKIEKCNNCVLLIDNEYAKNNPRNIKEKVVFLKKTIYDSEFENSIEKRKLLKNNVFRRKIILFLLRYRLVLVSYIFNIIYFNIKKLALRHSSFIKLESRASNNSR